MDRKGVNQRWHEYTTKLCDEASEPFEVEVMDNGLTIKGSEVEVAVKQMKQGKAIGEDGMAVEIVEALGAWTPTWWCKWQIRYMTQDRFQLQCSHRPS